MTSRHSTEHGFTLMELMVVVGIISIMAVLAIGMGTEAYQRQRFLGTVREVYHGLSLARTAAVTHGRPGCVAFGSTRLTAFLDRSDPANYVYDSATDDLLLQHPKAPESYGLTTNVSAGFPNAPSTSVPTAIFNSRGFSVTSGGAFQGGMVTITDSSISDGTRKVETTVGGAARITK